MKQKTEQEFEDTKSKCGKQVTKNHHSISTKRIFALTVTVEKCFNINEIK